MEFWKIILGLAARKLVGPPLVLLSLAVAAASFYFVPVHYTSNVLMVLTTSAKGAFTDPTKPAGLTNPLLQFSDGLKTTASILIQSMNTPDIKSALGAPVGGTTDLVIDDGRTDPDLLDISGPYIYISVDARTAAQASSVVDKAQTLIRESLDTRQKSLGAPRSTFIMVAGIVPASEPEMELGGKWQAAAVAFVLTLAGTLGIAYAFVRSRMVKRPVPVSQRPDPDISPWSDREDMTATTQWRADRLVRKPYPPMISNTTVERVDEERVDDLRVAPVVRDDDRYDDETIVIVLSDGDDGVGTGGWVTQNGSAPDDRQS